MKGVLVFVQNGIVDEVHADPGVRVTVLDRDTQCPETFIRSYEGTDNEALIDYIIELTEKLNKKEMQSCMDSTL